MIILLFLLNNVTEPHGIPPLTIGISLNTTKDSILAETSTADVRIVTVDFGSIANVRSAAQEIMGFPEDFHVSDSITP